MKTICIIAIIFTTTSLKAQLIQDPTADFVAHFTMKPGDSLYKVVAPVNRNGGKEYFFTYSPSDGDGRAGYIWTVYAPVNGGYKCLLNDLITFKPEHLTVGNFKELDGLGMLTYAPDSAGKGALIGFIFDGLTVKTLNLGTIEFYGKDKSLTDKYFAKEKHPNIEITHPSELPHQASNSN